MGSFEVAAPPRALSRIPPVLALAAGVAALCLLGTAIAAGTLLVRGARADVPGGEFAATYAAGTLARTGLHASLYDAQAQAFVQRVAQDAATRPATAFVAPAGVAWLAAPLSNLPYGIAYVLVALLDAALIALGAKLLSEHLARVPAWPRRVLVGGFALSTPAALSAGGARLDGVVFLSLLGGYLLLRRDREAMAGVALAPALVAPGALAGVVLMLLAWRQWKTLATLGGCALVACAPELAGGARNHVALALRDAWRPLLSGEVSASAGLRGLLAGALGADHAALWAPGALLLAVGALLAVRAPARRRRTSPTRSPSCCRCSSGRRLRRRRCWCCSFRARSRCAASSG